MFRYDDLFEQLRRMTLLQQPCPRPLHVDTPRHTEHPKSTHKPKYLIRRIQDTRYEKQNSTYSLLNILIKLHYCKYEISATVTVTFNMGCSQCCGPTVGLSILFLGSFSSMRIASDSAGFYRNQEFANGRAARDEGIFCACLHLT